MRSVFDRGEGVQDDRAIHVGMAAVEGGHVVHDAIAAAVVGSSGDIGGTLTLDAIRAAFDVKAEERR